MSQYVGPIDALADELLQALRNHPDISLDPVLGPETARLCAAYNRLYCELHDKEPPTIQGDAMSDLDVRQFDLRRLRQEGFGLNECPNGPDEDETYPCDPQVALGGGWAECQVCGRVGQWADKETPRE